MTDTVDLLFFDTFAHENNEELNLDLVQFPKPVYVTEVRIIPLGARVQADFPGGVRLGATNPTQFSIEFFVNDLGKPGASSFESLGGFEYNQNGCINLEYASDESVRKIPTDGLVLRGHYTTITLAVYGILTANIAEQIIQPIVTPSVPPPTNLLSEVPSAIPVTTIGSENKEWNQNVQPIPVEYSQQPTPAYAQAYPTSEPFKQEYPEYYTENLKDPRSFHNTPETDWDTKNRGRSLEKDTREVERPQNVEHLDRESTRSERDRSKHYSRSHSQDRDWQSRSRNYRDTNDWEHEYRDRQNTDWEHDRERNYKHQENYRRGYGRDDNREDRHPKSSKPRTPPGSSPKRPHTPYPSRKETSPVVKLENLSDEDFTPSERQEKARDEVTTKVVGEKVVLSKEPPERTSPLLEESNRMDVEEFEPILSDEDILDDSEHFQDLDFDYSAYTNNDDLLKLFIPGSTPLQKHIKPSAFILSDKTFEVNDELKATINIADDFFRSSITKYSLNDFEKLNAELKEEFIHLCEKLIPTLGDEENFSHIIKLYSLTQDIEQSRLNNSDKEIIKQIKVVTETLIEWIKIALNFEMANLQNQPPYKIRHIKCGIRLANWCSNSEDFIKLLWEHNYYIHEVLLNLYNEEYMALSIKLMILHALDTYLMHKSSIECFIAGTANNKENGFTKFVPSCSLNGYKALIEMINKNPSVRLKFALQSILRKLNLYEVLSKLHQTVANIRQHSVTNNDDLNFIIKSLEQILSVYRNGSLTVSQPKRFLPVSAQFEINRSETKNIFVLLFKMHHLVECFTLLLSFPSTINSWTLKTLIFDIISELLLSNDGLNYLCDNCDSLNILLKSLLQNEDAIHYMVPYSAKVLGLRIAYFVQSQYYIDYLLDQGEKHKFNFDIPEIIDKLHALFCLTFSNIGKLACAEVLGFNDNLKLLLKFLDILGLKDKSDMYLAKLKKSPSVGYVIDLVAYTVIYNSNITVVENCIKQLMLIINQQELFEDTVVIKINEFAPFVKPMENLLPLNYSNVTPIVDIILKYIDTVTTFPGQLITSLRVLQYLGMTKHNVPNENVLNNYNELKYKYVIIQLFANDGIAILTKLLQKICEFYEQPSLHMPTFASHQGVYIMSIIEPCINLLYQILSYVIQCRNTNFKDITTIPVLLQTYNLLRSFLPTSCMYFTAKNLCIKIIDILLVYTQPVSDEVNEKDTLNKTLWALMCNEVIKYINWAPYTFIAGLLIFSELLPLPLPVQTHYALTSEEVSFAVNLRKLWAAHLHTFSGNIQEFINRLCTSNNPLLLSLLRKVCIQLADLAASSALMIARVILDSVYGALISEEDDSTLQACTGNTARLLNLLACLVTHSSLKSAVLHFLHINNPNICKGDEKYSNLIQAFAKFLTINSTSLVHIQAQECILSIIQSLCDSEITLLQNSDITPEIYLANSLPTKETLLLFITMMMDHLMAENSFVTYLPIVRSLLLLTEHDYGFYHFKEYLSKKSEPFLPVLNKLASNFSNDSVECLSTLNTLMELMRVFITPAETIENVSSPRTMKLVPGEMKLLVGWKDLDDSGDDKHPLYILEELLKKNIEDDKTFENYLLEGVSDVISILKNTTTDVGESYSEPVLPQPLPLLAQFAGRTVFTLNDIVEEQITSMYWLAVPSNEGHCEAENVTCDLIDVCRQNLPPDTNLVREIEKVCQIYPSNNIEQEDLKLKGSDVQKEKTKKTFVTPLTRRGFPRTVQNRSDVFRSRPPNTSRPPSLHVDDFVALETCGAQPTGPTGYNKISRELLSTNRITRGSRGRSFVSCERTSQYRQMSWWNSGFGKGPY